MYKERESRLVPAIVAVVGVVAFAILVYMLLAGANWLINRVLGFGGGPNI